MRDWVAIIVATCGLIAGVYAARASLRASRVNQEGNQIKWLQEAKDDAREAKREADEVKEDLAETRREMTKTKNEAIQLRDDLEDVTRWVIRVVMWAHDESLIDGELRRLINGGPPQLRGKIPPAAGRGAG